MITELKQYIISKVQSIDDEVILNKIQFIIQNNENNYILSKEQMRLLNEADSQYLLKDYIEENEMDYKVEQWKSKK